MYWNLKIEVRLVILLLGVGLSNLLAREILMIFNMLNYPRGNFHSRTGEPVHSLNEILNVLEF